MVEEIVATRFRMKKSWYLCAVDSGRPKRTEAATAEGIVEARWFRRSELDEETVYPSIVTAHDWQEFHADGWQTVFDGPRRARF